MSKEIYISTTPHETRLAIVENDALAEIYYERENEYTLAGSIYNGRVTRVLPGMQSSFVDIGLERDAFLYITDFMEEAGDSADFESTSGDGRGARRDGRGSDSSPRRETASAEPADAQATSRAEAPRTERGGERNGERSGRRDRNSRRGGRDGRGTPKDDRGGQRDATASSARTPQVYESPIVDEEPEFLTSPTAEPEMGAETGEGAPGADGSRRWRGRRGRRRGRGTTEAGSPPEATAPQDGTFDGDSVEVGLPEMSVSAEVESSVERGREGRQDRNEGRRRQGRGERDARPDSGRDRTALPVSRAREEASDAVDIRASAEPFILPGESLSKYRRNADGSPVAGPAASASGASDITIAKPSTMYEMPTGWDGGAVLPGETLSRRSGKPGPGNRQDDRSSSYRSNREETPRRESRPARTLDPSEAVQPAVTSQHEPEAFELPAPSGGMTFEPAPMSEAQADTEPTVESATTSQEHHQALDSAEYEPAEDAAASFRVDPAAPSEYRQSAPAVEAEAIAPAGEDVLPQPVFHAAETDVYAEEPLPESQMTAIQDTGEMLSSTTDSAESLDLQSGLDETSPLEHEHAVTSVPSREFAATQPQQFAPGDGELEEEVLDDEDADSLTIHASSIYEDMEEETLEGAADLGTMIRDMSIDHLTAPTSAEEMEDDDDFEIDEEDLEEDEFDNGENASEDDFAEGEEFAHEDQSEEIEDREESEGQDAAERSARPVVEGESPRGGERTSRRDGGRRGGRDRGSRDRRPSGSGGKSSQGGGDRRPSRHSAQTTNLPAISDLLKPGQELLVQIAKEPIAKKGARITSHIALPGRFLVFMPTVSHVGVSRKIESDGERRRLKEILLSERGDASGGFIVRTAAANAGEDELRSDLRFLLNLWADIKTRSESSKSPALIYHDLNLVERILRDQVTDNFSAIWVDTEDAYERVLRFLQRFQPSLIRRVKLYTKETPLFEQFGITEEINKALRSKVWLKSGGSIVINQTEALVAIDINTGKFVGKTARLEDTIVKTNLDAIPEIVRQIRLRDLGGIIIIDFIDMDDRKNRHKVMAALEEELKSDRAPSKMLQFNDFGLIAITRKRVKQSLERTLSTTCGICQGTGMIKSPVTVCNDIYIEMRKMQKHLDRGDVMLRVNPEVVKQLKAPGAKWLQEMEEMVGKTILVKSDPSLHPEQFDLH